MPIIIILHEICIVIFQELLAQEKAQVSHSVNEELDLDELMDVS